ATSLNARALSPPFFEKSIARWLEILWLPPLPMNISLLPRSCDLCARLRKVSKPRSRPMSWPERSVTAVSRMAAARVSKYATILSRMGTSYLNNSLQQRGDGLDHGRFFDRRAMAHDFNLERADHVADEAHPVNRACGRDQWRRHRKEGITGPDRVHNLAGDGGNR